MRSRGAVEVHRHASRTRNRMWAHLPHVQVINWEAFDEAGVINARDVDELLFTDSVDEAFDHIIKAIGSHAPLSPSS